MGRDEENSATSGTRLACEMGWPPAGLSLPGGPVGAPKACRLCLLRRPHAETSATRRPTSASPCTTCWEEGTPPQPAPSPAPHLLVLLTCPDRAPDPPSPDPFVKLHSVLAHLESSPHVIQAPEP